MMVVFLSQALLCKVYNSKFRSSRSSMQIVLDLEINPYSTGWHIWYVAVDKEL
jgi:hypothetical protein